MARETCNPSAQETEGQGFQGQTRDQIMRSVQKTQFPYSKLGGRLYKELSGLESHS